MAPWQKVCTSCCSWSAAASSASSSSVFVSESSNVIVRWSMRTSCPTFSSESQSSLYVRRKRLMAEWRGSECSDVWRKQAMTARFRCTDTTLGAEALWSTAGWSIMCSP